MATKAPRLIGEIIPLGAGCAVRVLRYASGRALPEPRLLLVDGQPIASRLAALDLLGAYTRGEIAPRRLPVEVRQLDTARTAPDHLARKVDRVARLKDREALVNHAQTYEEEHTTKRRRKAKRNTVVARALPEITKLLPVEGPTQVIKGAGHAAQLAAEVERFLSTPRVPAGKRKAVLPVVTRCPEGENYRRPRRGGVLPGHLNPVVMA